MDTKLDTLSGNTSRETARRAARLVGATALTLGLLTGCASTGQDSGWNNKAKGAAGIGALAGTAVGAYMDAQQNKLSNRLEGTGVGVERVGDDLVLTMPSNITFDTASSEVKSDFHNVLSAVADVLSEYDKTYIDIAGHTDSRGSLAYNQTLSEQRAMSVGSLLVARGVQNVRVVAQGMGETQPVADNESVNGRAQNRRVNLKLKPITEPG